MCHTMCPGADGHGHARGGFPDVEQCRVSLLLYAKQDCLRREGFFTAVPQAQLRLQSAVNPSDFSRSWEVSLAW